jgi:hypothetical protein
MRACDEFLDRFTRVMVCACLLATHTAHAGHIVVDPLATSTLQVSELPGLAPLLPLDQGRSPARKVNGPESATLRRAIDFVFADKSKSERRRIFKQTLNLAATTPPVSLDRSVLRARLLDVTAETIERAIDARRNEDVAEVRRSARNALAALGWMYRAAGATTANSTTMREARRWWFYRLSLATQVGSAAGFFGAASVHSVPVGMFCFFWFLFNALANFGLLVDYLTRPMIVDDLARMVTFAGSRATDKAIASEIATFWFELEKRLAKRDEWRAWVKSRAQRPGEDNIASDVRDFLRALVGAKSLEAVCDELLAPGALASPFF